jgi:hypothetical protein
MEVLCLVISWPEEQAERVGREWKVEEGRFDRRDHVIRRVARSKETRPKLKGSVSLYWTSQNPLGKSASQKSQRHKT